MKTAIVTGGTSGIGFGVAQMLLNKGYQVFATYIGADFTENINNYETVKIDQTKREDVYRFIKYVKSKTDHVDCIVCNAGICADNAFPALTDENWDSVIHTNLDSFYNVLKPLVMGMASRKNKRGGRIITVASVSGIIGNRGQTNYSASKGGIIAATKALAVELAGRNVTCNVIAPGAIETEMTANIIPEAKEIMLSTIPMKRMGQPEEIGATAVFLLSEGASYITRQVITVDGGMVG